MPKVLYYGSTAQIHSGACQWMKRMADDMRNYGFETKAILPENRGIASWYIDSEIPIEYLWSEPIRRQRSLLGQLRYICLALITTVNLWLQIRREEIDIVHVNEIRFLPGLLAGAVSGAYTVCNVRICFESPLLRWIFGGIVYLLSDTVICVSNRTAEMMFESVGFTGDKVRVIHDGLPSPGRFEDLPEGDVFRDEFGIDDDDFLVVSVSKLVRNKGQDRILDAATQLPLDDDVEFAIVGGTVKDHEEYAAELAERAEEIRNVQLTGFYEDLSEVLGAANALIHVPRHEDPFPGVVLEGMICKLPVIGSRSGGIPEQIDDGETGYLVPKEGGERQIADYISTLAVEDELCERLGEAGRQRAFEHFDMDEYFERIKEEYNTLLSE